MPIKSMFIILSVLFFSTQFGINPAFSDDNGNSQKITVRPVTGFNETRFDFLSQDLVHGLVIVETPQRKKKRILPFFLWVGASWFALDAMNDGSGGSPNVPVNENEFFATLDLKCTQRISDAANSWRIIPTQFNWINDTQINIDSAIIAQSKLSWVVKDNPEWKNGFLIGRLNPLYVSLSKANNDTSKILIAGLNNLGDGEIAQIELYDDALHYTIQLNRNDGDGFGVFKTEVELLTSRVRMSIQIIR